ncbi:MAG: GWxTD domain-containing protein [Calditrichaeota bacterium]|nr:MAG: GWxTD domain-containing protein [Calditrichota bacterium]
MLPHATLLVPGRTCFAFLFTAILFAATLPRTALLAGENSSPAGTYSFQFLTYRAFEAEKTLLEVFCLLPLQSLDFTQMADSLETEYDLAIALLDSQAMPAAHLHHRQQLCLATDSQLDPTMSPQLVRFQFVLAPGAYTAEVSMTSGRNRHRFTLRHELNVPNYCRGGLRLSDLELASEILRSKESSPLVKNGRKVIPNVNHVFQEGHPLLHVYFEVYNLSFASTGLGLGVLSTATIADRTGRVVARTKQRFFKPGTSCAVNMAVPIGRLAAGVYELLVDLQDLDTGEATHQVTRFQVVKPLDRYSKGDLNQLLERLSQIGLTRPLTLDSVPEDESEAQAGVYHSRELMEYLRRLLYSEQHFGTPSAEGWQTDRGRVFVRHGSPRAIRHVAGAGGIRTVEIWEYPAKRFVFVDDTGLGTFHLVDSAEQARAGISP